MCLCVSMHAIVVALTVSTGIMWTMLRLHPSLKAPSRISANSCSLTPEKYDDVKRKK